MDAVFFYAGVFTFSDAIEGGSSVWFVWTGRIPIPAYTGFALEVTYAITFIFPVPPVLDAVWI